MTAAPALPPPPITWWGHVWRLSAVIITSFFLFVVTAVDRLQIQADGTATNATSTVAWLLLLDAVLGVVSFGLVLLRRRWPVAIALVTAITASFSAASAGSAVLAMVSLATRRRWQDIALLAPPNVLGAAFFEHMTQSDPLPWPVLLIVGTAIYAAIVGMGLYIGARRDLIATLRWRAETAEQAQQARVEQAQSAERNRIAREMHDVLAHRISVVAMYSGALSSREDLTADERRDTARVIEDNARAALTDLREVLGVLRQPTAGAAAGAVEPPQPTLAVLDALVADARELGDEVSVEVVPGAEVEPRAWLAQLPEGVSRAAYRMVQEGLTNARKHAPGAAVRLRVEEAEEGQLVVDLRNGPPVVPDAAAPGRPVPGSGLGLVGLRERAELLGGSLEARPLPDGGFLLRARLPWRA